MSIFKDTFPKGVKNQLTTRQNKMIARDSDTIRYLNSRTAWIRMISAVNINGSNNPAKNNVLLGGALSNNSLRHGVGTTGTEAYSIKTPSGTSHRLGIRPMPGITSLEVKSKGAYGSLKEVTVNFQCWDIHQLEELELLYMRPGYSVLVEWGWVPYLDNNGHLKADIPLNDDVLNGGKTKEEIWKDIHEKASANGNYDAAYGIVKNYSWSARADGGYDCSTEITTIGEIIESLKVNYCDFSSNISEIGQFGMLYTSDPSFFEKNSEVNQSYTQNKLAGILNEIWRTIVEGNLITVGGAGSFGHSKITLDGYEYSFLQYDLDISGKTSSDEDSFVNEKQQIYFRLRDFVHIMNKYILLYDKKADKPVVTLSVQKGEHNGGTEKDLLCLGNKFQLSIDPSICLIKNVAWTDPKANLNVDTEDTDTETIKQIMTDIPEDYFLDGDFSGKQIGIIGNIYVNITYLYSLIIDDELASQDKKEKKEISLRDFMKSVLSGINTSIGNVATLDLFVDPVDSVARIIDLNYVNEESDSSKVYNNAFVLEMHNLHSTVRSYNLESQIFPEQSTTVAIAAQSGDGALSIEDTTLLTFNTGLKDRIIPRKKNPPSNEEKSEADKEKAKLEAYKTNIDTILSYINKSDPSWYEHSGDFDAGDAGKFANALRDIINSQKATVEDNTKNKEPIPTRLSIEMDGIGGIVIGNLFRIPEDLLPKGYKGSGGVGPKYIVYTVTGINSYIKGGNNDWVTKLEAKFIILDEPSQEAIAASKSSWSSAKTIRTSKTTLQNQNLTAPKSTVTTAVSTSTTTLTTTLSNAPSTSLDFDLFMYLSWQQGSWGAAQHYSLWKNNNKFKKYSISLKNISGNWPGGYVSSKGVKASDVSFLYFGDQNKLAEAFVDVWKQAYTKKTSKAKELINSMGKNQSGVPYSEIKAAFDKYQRPSEGLTSQSLANFGMIENGLDTSTRSSNRYQTMFQMDSSNPSYSVVINSLSKTFNKNGSLIMYGSIDSLVKQVVPLILDGFNSFKKYSGWQG